MSTRTMFVAMVGVVSAAALIGAATLAMHSDKPVAHAAAKLPAASATSAAAPPASADVAHTTVAESAAKEPMRLAGPVTITGCLERDAKAFWLKDTAGENAPKARSWKSGFLKKGSASIQVIDAANRAKLPTHVGQRVSVTGTLVDREMQVRSLQRIAASCSAVKAGDVAMR